MWSVLPLLLSVGAQKEVPLASAASLEAQDSGKVLALSACRILNLEQDNIAITSKTFDSLGPATVFTIDDDKKIAIPQSFHFCFHSERLRFMNRMEWHALIQIKKKTNQLNDFG